MWKSGFKSPVDRADVSQETLCYWICVYAKNLWRWKNNSSLGFYRYYGCKDKTTHTAVLWTSLHVLWTLWPAWILQCSKSAQQIRTNSKAKKPSESQQRRRCLSPPLPRRLPGWRAGDKGPLICTAVSYVSTFAVSNKKAFFPRTVTCNFSNSQVFSQAFVWNALNGSLKLKIK